MSFCLKKQGLVFRLNDQRLPEWRNGSATDL